MNSVITMKPGRKKVHTSSRLVIPGFQSDMYKMATACVPSGTILVVHLQKCSHLSKFFCIEFQTLGKTTYPSGWQIWMFPYTEGCNCFIIFYRLSPLWGKIGLFGGNNRVVIALLYFCQCFIGYLPCGGKFGCFPAVNFLPMFYRLSPLWGKIGLFSREQ